MCIGSHVLNKSPSHTPNFFSQLFFLLLKFHHKDVSMCCVCPICLRERGEIGSFSVCCNNQRARHMVHVKHIKNCCKVEQKGLPEMQQQKGNSGLVYKQR